MPANSTARLDVALEGRAEFAGVLGVEVDLVGLTVEAERDGLLLGGGFFADDAGGPGLWLVRVLVKPGDGLGQLVRDPFDETAHRGGAEGEKHTKRPVNKHDDSIRSRLGRAC